LKSELRNSANSFAWKGDVLTILIYFGIYSALIAAVHLVWGIYAPEPLNPLIETPVWASSYDLYFLFPILSVMTMIPFTGKFLRRIIFPMSVITPIYLVCYSYLQNYTLSFIPFLDHHVLNSALVLPYLLIFLIPAIPLVGTIIIAYYATNTPVGRVRFGKKYFKVLVATSIILTTVEILVRYFENNSPLTNISDVGYLIQAGGSYVLKGINPYSVPLPPWGTLTSFRNSPLAFASVAPLSFLPIILAAHLNTIIFSAVLGVGLWKLMKIIAPNYAYISTLLFFGLPMISFEIMASYVNDILGAAFIVWSLYFFIRNRKAIASMLALLGAGVLIIPAALIIPYIFYSKGRDRTLISVVFFIPLIFGILALYEFTDLSLYSIYLNFIGLFGFYYGFLLSPGFSIILGLIPALALVIWYIYSSSMILSDLDLIRVTSIFYLLLPFMFGDFYAFYYVWEFVLIIPAVFGYREARSPLHAITTKTVIIDNSNT
jgi:hypothetical protein